MEATSFTSSLIQPPQFHPRQQNQRISFYQRKRAVYNFRACGKIDNDMVTLRKRIREAKALDQRVVNDNNKMMAELKEKIEKEFDYKIYESSLLQIVGLIQLQLINSTIDDDDDDHHQKELMRSEQRPSLAVRTTVTITLSIPVEVVVVGMHLRDAAKGILDVIYSSKVKEY